MIKLAFIMPTAPQSREIDRVRESVVEFRPDQLAHFEHLLRSWGAFGRWDGLAVTWRAVKRVLRDRP